MNTTNFLFAFFIGISFFVYTPTIAQNNEIVTTETVATSTNSEVPIAAEFIYRVEDCLLLIFTNTSLGAFEASFHWSFGDGDSSTFKDPVHRYEEAGTYTITLFAIDNTGKQVQVTKTVEVGCGVGIQETTAYPNLVAYPNPAHVSVSLDLTILPPAANYEVRIFDMMGRSMDRMNSQNKVLHIPVLNWTSGIYIYQVVNEKGEVMKNERFVVK